MMLEKNIRLQHLSNATARALSNLQIIQYFIKNTKHIDTQFHFVREKVQSREVHIEYCNTCDNVVDIFTKPLNRIKFELFREMLGILVNPFLH